MCFSDGFYPKKSILNSIRDKYLGQMNGRELELPSPPLPLFFFF